MQPSNDYYQVLGVPRDADQRTIKRAFLKKAREVHPDVSDAPDAEEQFKQVNEAYSVLSDERRRQNYDQFGDPDGPGGFGGGDYVDMSDIFGGFGMDDIFSSFFGGSAAGGGRAARTRGRDMGITLHVTLAEAASGCKKTVAYERLAPCDDCGGTGVAAGGSVRTCGRCHGTGRVVQVQRTILGSMQTQATCPDCHGTGHVVDKPCETCGGQGRTPSHETVEVEIPAGIHSGQQLKVEGRGEAGVRGDRGGDLVVGIDVADDPRFTRQGDDLFCERTVSAIQAMLGCTVSVEGVLEGERVEVEVPAGTQYGDQVSAEGHGMPRLGSSARGRLVVVVRVSVPADLSAQDRAALEGIAERRGESLEAERDPAEGPAPEAGGRRGRKPRPKAKPRVRKGRRG
jgi:molecular chaperone DnaJ